MKLTPEQVVQFNHDGYLILPALFSPDEIRRMAEEADRILNLCVNTSLALKERDLRMRVQARHGQLNVQKIQPINDLSPYLKTVSQDERLVGPLRQLMGGHEPVLMEEKLNCKQLLHQEIDLSPFNTNGEEDSFPLHHDWGYYRQQGYPTETLSSAISIDTSTPDNGPLRVIPGTHKTDWPLIDPDPAHGRGEIVEEIFEGVPRVQCLAPGGSVMLFHSKLVHDSNSNNTGQPRRIMIYSHYPGYHQAEEDQRNRANRLKAQTQEERYRQMVAAGQYQDRRFGG
jgi:ectoine hydroxylase